MNGAAIPARLAYSRTASIFHWAVGLPMMGSIGAVLQAQRVPKSEKQFWMHQHESLGLLSAMILVPRLAYRVVAPAAYRVVDLKPIGSTATHSVEKIAKDATALGLNGFAVVLSVTGVGMNYISGWGLPFFWTKIPGLKQTPDTKAKYMPLAKQMYQVHKTVGYYGKYLIPLHVGGTMAHAAKGEAVLARIKPW